MLCIQDDTVIVSDVHYSKDNKSFISHLEKCKAKQIILNGDIFEFASGYINESIQYNIELIDKINDLAKTKDIIYLEGNHDFGLKNILKNIKIIDIQNQPIKCKYKQKIVYISHGDCFSNSIIYKIYSKIIRSKICLRTINFIEKANRNKIFYSVIKNQLLKNKCKKIKNFENIAKNKISKYNKNADIIIEGHYHQDMQITHNNVTYINLPAFCCDEKIYTFLELINKKQHKD